MTSPGWYVRRADQLTGPFTLKELQAQITQKTLTPQSQVTTDGVHWLAAKDIQGLNFDHLASAAVDRRYSADSLSWSEIRTLANWQRFGNLGVVALIPLYSALRIAAGDPTSWGAAASFSLIFLSTAVQFGFVLGIVQTLRRENPWVWGLGSTIPIAGGLVLYNASRAATKTLLAQGIPVGFLGATAPAAPPPDWTYQGPRPIVEQSQRGPGTICLAAAISGVIVGVLYVVVSVLHFASVQVPPVGPPGPIPPQKPAAALPWDRDLLLRCGIARDQGDDFKKSITESSVATEHILSSETGT